jgi:hypothetical protein
LWTCNSEILRVPVSSSMISHSNSVSWSAIIGL